MALARAALLETGALQVGDHLLVAHFVARKQRLDLVHPEQGELRLGDGQDVGAGSLDGQHFLLAPGVVAHAQFGAGIPAEDVDHRAVEPQNVAAVDEAVQIRQRGGVAFIPVISWHGFPFQPKAAEVERLPSIQQRAARRAV